MKKNKSRNINCKPVNPEVQVQIISRPLINKQPASFLQKFKLIGQGAIGTTVDAVDNGPNVGFVVVWVKIVEAVDKGPNVAFVGVSVIVVEAVDNGPNVDCDFTL